MKKKFGYIVIIALLLISLNFSTLIFAEIIILKSGKTVEGKIIEKTDQYIKIDFYGVILTYFLDEVESIEGLKQVKPSGASTAVQSIPENGEKRSDWYVNEECGIKIKKVPNWEFKESKKIEQGIPMLSLVFAKMSERVNFKNLLIVNISKMPEGEYLKGDDFFAYVDSVNHHATKNLKNLTFTKQPNIILINGVKAKELAFEFDEETMNNERFTGRLINFHPVETKKGIRSIFVFLKCISEDYSSFHSDIENTLASIEIIK